MQFYSKAIVCIASAVSLVACSNLTTGNLFSHYSAQNRNLHQLVQNGEYAQAEQTLPEYVGGDILDSFEKGRIYLLNQQYQESKAVLEIADQAVISEQNKATISLSETATSIGSLAINDNLNSYQPPDYELGFLHLYLGLNYLQSNDLEGALVEMRRANKVQEQARANRERELKAAEEQLASQGLSPNLGSILANYPNGGETLKSVQNGYLFFLSALLYEAEGDLNSAYVDYRRALAVAPKNQEVVDGTKRVAKRLGMQSDLTKLEKRYGKTDHLNRQQSRVIVIDERGVVQALEDWRLSLPIYDSRDVLALYTLALPYYPQTAHEKYPSLVLNDKEINSSQLTNVDQMAQYDLSERLPSIIIRQALRVWAKDRLRKESVNEDEVANLLFNVWNTLTEQPDTRSWLTLPSSVHTASYIVEPGQQTLHIGGKEYAFNVSSGETALVWLSRQGNNSVIWHKQLGNIR